MEKLAAVVFVDLYSIGQAGIQPDAYAYQVSQKHEEEHITFFESSSHDVSDGKIKDFAGDTLAVQFLILVISKLCVDIIG